MSANIDLSACKGEISPINTGCLWNTNDALIIAESCCRFSATCVELSGRENREEGRERDQRRDRERERQELEGGKMKQGEGGGMKRMTMSEI